MAGKTRKQRWAELHATAVADFNTIWSAVQDERRQALQDRRFYSITGAQWEDQLGDQFDGLPKFEVNKIHQSIIRIFSEYRNNRITVKFRPDDADSSTDTADTMSGRYRADEQRSNAQEAYDNAFEEAVGGGMGAFRYRVVNADEDEDSEDGDADNLQTMIEPIFDADSSVFFDLNAKRQDKSDAKRCYVISSYARADYDEKWGKKFNLTSWQVPKDSTYFDWCTPDVVYIAECYFIEQTKELRHIFQSKVTQEEVSLTDEDMEDEDYLADLQATGFEHARDEKIKRPKVHKWLMNGCEIMEDQGYIPGRYIPVVPVYGKRWFVDNIERFMGQVRLAKDSQRLLNMVISRLAELNTLAPYERPIFTPEQIAGHQTQWEESNLKRTPYLLINAIKDAQGGKTPAGPVGNVKPPDVPPAMAALATVVSGAIDELTGGAQTEANAMPSAVAENTVRLVQKRLDMQSFIYTDNMAKAVCQGGRIWLSIQKDIMPDEPHKAPVAKPDGTQDFVDMLAPTKDAQGNTVPGNDPRRGKYAPWADVGPSFQSRRDSTVQSILDFMSVNTTDPQIQTVLMSAAIINMDGEGLDDLRKYFRKKLVAMGAVTPTDDEKEELQQEQAAQPPDPNATFLNSQARLNDAKSGQAHVDTIQSAAKVENIAADTGLKQAQAHTAGISSALQLVAAATAPPQEAAPAPA